MLGEYENVGRAEHLKATTGHMGVIALKAGVGGANHTVDFGVTEDEACDVLHLMMAELEANTTRVTTVQEGMVSTYVNSGATP